MDWQWHPSGTQQSVFQKLLKTFAEADRSQNRRKNFFIKTMHLDIMRRTLQFLAGTGINFLEVPSYSPDLAPVIFGFFLS
jgi:hypothetical protein